jgi:hypothetical protein
LQKKIFRKVLQLHYWKMVPFLFMLVVWFKKFLWIWKIEAFHLSMAIESSWLWKLNLVLVPGIRDEDIMQMIK